MRYARNLKGVESPKKSSVKSKKMYKPVRPKPEPSVRIPKPKVETPRPERPWHKKKVLNKSYNPKKTHLRYRFKLKSDELKQEVPPETVTETPMRRVYKPFI